MAGTKSKMLRLRAEAIKDSLNLGLAQYESFLKENSRILASLKWRRQNPELAEKYEKIAGNTFDAHKMWLAEVKVDLAPLVARTKQRLQLVDEILQRSISSS
jgi:hypothetical protein